MVMLIVLYLHPSCLASLWGIVSRYWNKIFLHLLPLFASMLVSWWLMRCLVLECIYISLQLSSNISVALRCFAWKFLGSAQFSKIWLNFFEYSWYLFNFSNTTLLLIKCFFSSTNHQQIFLLFLLVLLNNFFFSSCILFH